MNRRKLLAMLVAAPVLPSVVRITQGKAEVITIPRAHGPVGQIVTIVKVGPDHWIIQGGPDAKGIRAV